MQRTFGICLSWTACTLLVAAACRADDNAEPSTKTHLATHKQVRKIHPAHNGQPVHLNTYCLSPAGDILACVGGSNYSYKRDANGNYTTEEVNGASLVQVYSPEGDLKAEWPLPFKPTAINVAPDHTIFVAGDAKMARLSAKGDVLTSANIPNIGDPDQFREQMAAKLRAQNEDLITRLKKQMEFAQQQAEKIEGVAEEERSASQKARLKAYVRQQQLYQTQLDALENQELAVESVTAHGSTKVVALAVSDAHVFVCATSALGSGYDVYRCDFDFQNPKEVLTGLRGCCGQMDIQAFKDKLLAAENTKFQVGIYDEDGKDLNSFGSRNRSGGAGFGSCCNPMNVRCCPNGDILTAESSVGDIKRFSPDGDYLAYVGRAKISGGCKNVAIAWDEKLDRYYMMNASDSSICVLVPLAEAPEFTEDELLAKAAQAGLGQKLIGDWKIPGTKASTQPKSAFAIALSSLLGGDAEQEAAAEGNTNVAFERVNFGADGKLTIAGGMYGQWGVVDWTWAAVRQDLDKQTVDFDMLTDGVQYQQFRCELQEGGGLKISLLNDGQTIMTGAYEHDAGDAAAEPAADEAKPAPTAEKASETSIPKE